MTRFLKKQRKPLITALILTTLAFFISFLFIRFCGYIFAPLMGEYAAVFRQLKTARITWNPLIPVGMFLVSAALECAVKKRGILTAVLAVFGFAAALFFMNVNDIPLTAAVKTALKLLG